MSGVVFLISLLASTIGALCGIGGGIIMKPAIDALTSLSASTVSFLSSCTVLAMAGYSVIRNTNQGENAIRWEKTVPLAIGAVVGGWLGQSFFQTVKASLGDTAAGHTQAAILLGLTFCTFIYVLNEKKIKSLNIQNIPVLLLVGAVLGLLSSFLGIGGGPFNIVFLSFFIGIRGKNAVLNSLTIILFSQISSLVKLLINGRVPDFSWLMLLLTIAAGIFGGIIGKSINKKIDDDMTHKLFVFVNILVIGLCIVNLMK